MLTAGDIVDAVRASGYSTDQDDSAFIMLNIEQRTVAADHRWRFLLATTTIAAVAGTDTYSLAGIADLMHIESVRLAVPATESPELTWMDSEELLERAAEAVLYPDYCTTRFWSDVTPSTLQLYPAPLVPGTITVRYLRKVTDITQESDIPDVPTEYLDVLRAGVCMRLAARERQWDAKQQFEAERAGLLAAMKGQYGLRQRQSAHRVVQSGRYGVDRAPGRLRF